MANPQIPIDPEEGFDGKEPAGWGRKLVAISVVLIAVLGGWAFFTAYILIEPQEEVKPVPVVDLYPEDPDEAVALALKAWERFVEAPTFSSRLIEVRDPDRVKPMMEDYHLVRKHPLPGMNKISPGTSVNLGERRFVFFEVQGFDGVTYPVALEWSGDRFLVDWESLSVYGTMDWAELIETRPEQTQTMRVYLAGLAENLKPPVEGERLWSFFRMEHRDGMDTVVVGATDLLAREISEMVERRRAPATVELRWNAEIRQFEVVRLVARTWSL